MKRTLILMGIAVLVLAGCGGGGGSLTPAQYVAKVNSLCLDSAHAVGAMHLTGNMPDWVDHGRQIIGAGERFNSELAALKPPTTLVSVAKAYLKANQKVLADNKAAVAAAQAGDAKAFHAALVKANTDVGFAVPLAQMLGAKSCYAP